MRFWYSNFKSINKNSAMLENMENFCFQQKKRRLYQPLLKKGCFQTVYNSSIKYK